MQINLSSLSPAQKKFYVQLLAHSNLQFTQHNDQFVAQFKVDPRNAQHKPDTRIAQHKPDTRIAQAKPQVQTAMQEISNNSGLQQPRCGSKKSPSVNRKRLGRVVKLGGLKRFEELHPWVQVYVYPKRMSAGQLHQVIESLYQKFWQEHKKKSAELRTVSFPEWVYRQVGSLRDKLRLEQTLVNLLDSVVHFAPRQQGVALFAQFLGQQWPIEALFYFLVLRGLLEQGTDRVLEKTQGGQGLQGVLGFRLRSDPHERVLTEEEVVTFLQTLDREGLFCCRSRPKTFESVFQQVTLKMYFDEHRKKNCLPLYQLLQHLLVEFQEGEVSSCDMSLSKTEMSNQDQSLSQLITDSHSKSPSREPHSWGPHSREPHSKPQCEVTLEEADQQSFQQRQKQQNTQDLGSQFEAMVKARATEMCHRLGSPMSRECLDCIRAGVEAVTRLEKAIWIAHRGQVSEAELSALEKLQSQFRQHSSPVLLTKLVKDFLLLPPIRELLVKAITL